MRGRKLYLNLAEACLGNAKDHFNDAKALRKRGSRGHAYSHAILSIEEAAKAYLYKLAGEGVFRIVSKNPNGISTYSEKQLFDHKFKHSLIARIVVQGILYAPVHRVLAKSKAKSFSRRRVEAMLGDLLHEQGLQQIRLQSGGQAARAVASLFAALEKANDRKNLGFYVDQKDGKVQVPDDCSKKDLREGLELAASTLEVVDEIVNSSLSREARERAAKGLREDTIALKLASARAKRATK
ncbi:MAG: AbiV family abortive infection protein [Thermoplasmata archaeon]